jgi:hypothetical protein
MHLGDWLDSGRYTLVAMTSRQFGKAHAIGFNESHTRFLRPLYELTHTGIAASGFKVNFNDGLRRCFKAHTHRMKTKQNFGRRHAPIILGI